MSDITELYQALIIDHGRRPRNFGESINANHVFEGFNPLCGDRLTVYVTEENNCVVASCFKGVGCAISIASASLMTEAIKGKTLLQVKELFSEFHQLIIERKLDKNLGKLQALAGVAEFPARVKCAMLPWHTLLNAIKDKN